MATKTSRTKRTTKKAAPKKATKKTAKKSAKKTTTKSRAEKRPLVQAAPQEAFWVRNGAILHNLVELANECTEMNKATYQYHVNKEKNDFAAWVEHVLHDSDCATNLRAATTPKKASTVITKHLKGYQL